MNILTDTLPKTVEVGGVHYAINTDFRAGIAFEMAIQEGKASVPDLLLPFFNEAIPQDIIGAIKAIELFYCCGQLPQTENSKPIKGKQAYSFAVDANAIFADFWNFYNIDLSQEGLHWWAFRSLLEGLPEKSEFKQRIYYRTCDLKGLTKKEKDRIMRIRSKIEIKSSEQGKTTLEERNKNMLNYIAKRSKEAQEVTNNGK